MPSTQISRLLGPKNRFLPNTLLRDMEQMDRKKEIASTSIFSVPCTEATLCHGKRAEMNTSTATAVAKSRVRSELVPKGQENYKIQVCEGKDVSKVVRVKYEAQAKDQIPYSPIFQEVKGLARRHMALSSLKSSPCAAWLPKLVSLLSHFPSPS